MVELRQLPGKERRQECGHIDIGPRVVEGEARQVGAAFLAVVDLAARKSVPHTKSVIGSAVNEAAATKGEVLKDVRVHVGKPEEVAVVELDAFNLAAGVRLFLRMLQTAGRLLQEQVGG